MVAMRLKMLSILVVAGASAQSATPLRPAIPPAAPAGMAGMNHGDMIVPKVPTLLEGYGSGGFPITTAVPRAQAFFDNGMELAHAFAHQASIAAMAEAVRLDPACAMCRWGQAWASGPTINYGKSPAEVTALARQVEVAATLAGKAGTDRERALIRALGLRYHDGGGGKPGDLNFAKAMQALASRYPGDEAIAVLAADAWLIAPANGHDEAVLNAGLAMPLLERVLATHPDYTPAIHFYIHATETAGVPGQAERYADRLAALAPRASHLVHMPSHTFYWVGRYQDAADVNMRAVEIGIANAKALGLPAPDGVWGLPYHAHNVTFGLGGALMAGDARTALALGRPLVRRAQKDTGSGAVMQLLSTLGYAALGRYADPAEVFALPEPKRPFLLAAWHYARGEAHARSGDAGRVREEAGAIRDVPGRAGDGGTIAAQQMTVIARDVLNGRAAMMEHRYDDAVAAFRAAATLQESAAFSVYADPPAWYYPARRDVAAALFAEGDLQAARREAEATLAYRPKDPPTMALLARTGVGTAQR